MLYRYVVSLISHHGCLLACTSPVLDVQLQTLYQAHQHSRLLDVVQATAQFIELTRYVFTPSVYDSIIIVRPSISFHLMPS